MEFHKKYFMFLSMNNIYIIYSSFHTSTKLSVEVEVYVFLS